MINSNIELCWNTIDMFSIDVFITWFNVNSMRVRNDPPALLYTAPPYTDSGL